MLHSQHSSVAFSVIWTFSVFYLHGMHGKAKHWLYCHSSLERRAFLMLCGTQRWSRPPLRARTPQLSRPSPLAQVPAAVAAHDAPLLLAMLKYPYFANKLIPWSVPHPSAQLTCPSASCNSKGELQLFSSSLNSLWAARTKASPKLTGFTCKCSPALPEIRNKRNSYLITSMKTFHTESKHPELMLWFRIWSPQNTLLFQGPHPRTSLTDKVTQEKAHPMNL